MSKFFVGQRVRKVRGENNVGMTGVVAGTESFAAGKHGPHPFYAAGFSLIRPSDLQVRFDAAWVSKSGRGFGADRVAFGQAGNFEPIAPEGAQPSEYTTLHDLLTSLEGVAA